MDYFKSKPDAYIRFTWKGKEVEGELFRSSEFSDSGIIRPFNKNLRQAFIDDKLKYRPMSFDEFTDVEELIACDGIATDYSVDIGSGAYKIVESYYLIDKKELTSDKEEIADCRCELLTRQENIAMQMYPYGGTKATKKAMEALRSERNKYACLEFEPLRYQLTISKKLWLFVTIHYVQWLVILVFLGGLFLLY